ncbi:MAG: OsmC family protein [Crocinitomicaceae bacterium]|nr:OsmC family protein [Crocinitomicaceae bacterium]
MSEEQHIETFKATGNANGWPTKVIISDTEWTIQVDEPTEDGGSNSGPNPMQYFSASLVSCQNEQAQVVAEELSLKIDTIDIDLELDLDLSGFMGMADNSEGSYKRVLLKAIVKGDVTDEQVIELGNRVDSRCPILGLLRSSGCEINSSWIVAKN